MRLLQRKDDNEFSLTKDIVDNIPAYAILSHTWGDDDQEVTFKDLVEGSGTSKAGYRKIQFCGDQAARDGLQYIWVDTCCIDKTDAVELQKAINSMFRWYKNAVKCYVYLSDVSMPDDKENNSSLDLESAFRTARWFTRGWTLQELLAPSSVEFFAADYQRLGNRASLERVIYEITGIPVKALQGYDPMRFSVEERVSWMAKRETKHEEDMAYSLLGIFAIFLPLIYGEGRENAFRRLREEVDRSNKLPKSGVENQVKSTVPFVRDLKVVCREDIMQEINSKMSHPLSAATVHHENSLSLANINFDFTLVKLSPPKEYDGLGASISVRRKSDAEDGELHRTARRLGALFEIILPTTPALFRAYGQRVSEISQSELVAPQASSRYGIFTKELGADCTSIWAAVTSGDGSIAAHLLGCMLARMFTIEQATSIWDELVRTQKQWIRHESAKATYSNKYDAALVAAQQALPRTELGKWDASARSWLESADLVKAREHKQLMLILDNASVPINSEINVYKSVTKAWCEALKAMDDLVQGIPQQVQDGAVLLAISAWHLYPNLTVLGCGLGTTDVQQRDKIFLDTAVITLGMRVINESQKSVSWSLPLAHLRFYGKPVKTLRSVGQENSRVSMDEFAYIVIGCVFGGWGAFAKSFEEGAQWLERIMKLITSKDPNGFALVEEVHSEHFWLSHLWNAVNRLRGCNEIDRKFAMQLYALGERRPKFLSGQLEHPPPLFGLSNMSVLLPMMQCCELRIAFLRRLAKEYNLPNNKFIIRYHTDEEDDRYPYEYTTLDEVETIRPKRFRSGSPKRNANPSGRPVRWVAVPIETMSAIYHCRRADWEPGRDYLHTPDSCETTHICVLSLETLCPLCYHSLHTSYCAQCAAPRTQHLWARSRKIRGLGENCRLAVETTLHDQSISHSNKSRYLRFGQGTDFETDLKSFRPDIFNDMSGFPTQQYAEFTFVIGDPESAAILEIKLAPPPPQPDQRPPPTFSRAQLLPSQVETILQAENINTSRFKDYFLRLGSHWRVYCGSLKAFAAAADLFKHLTNATVSASISSRLLLRSKWVPGDQGSLSYFSLSRAQAFSCISMFDSAACDLDPEALKEVFALSVGSSIYVAEAMLCDPSQSTKDTNIRRVIGNLGRAGISLLIPPADPAVREPVDESWMLINHTKFDGQVEDCFQHTSSHLSFTGYEMPLSIDSGSGHTIDRPASLLETLVSVYDRGSWVADLDMSTLLCKLSHDTFERPVCSCKGPGHTSKHAFQQLSHEASNLHSLLSWTCIDNWDEFIDPPRSQILVIRAHRNWLARLAFASISVAQGHRTVVLPDSICWKCCIRTIYGNLPESELVVGGSVVELKRRIVLIS